MEEYKIKPNHLAICWKQPFLISSLWFNYTVKHQQFSEIMFYSIKMAILCTSCVFLRCSPRVGLPPSLLSPPHPLLSAQSHQSFTSMHFSSGHNGDHMLKRALKPNTGHLPSNKSCCQQQGRALPMRNDSVSASASPARHSVETGRKAR